jgi:multiple sugar transport system ATP-binding protein
MTLGQRVAVMRDGRILQVDEPQRLYQSPQDLFVAAFIGSPAMNLVDAVIEGDEVCFGQYRVPLAPGRRPPAGTTRVVLGIRPECFADAAFVAESPVTVEARVEVLEEVGADAYLFFEVNAPRITAETLEAAADDGTLLADDNSLFAARVDPRTRARVGEPIDLAVYPTGFHFFDPATGVALTTGDATAPRADAEPVIAAGVE